MCNPKIIPRALGAIASVALLAGSIAAMADADTNPDTTSGIGSGSYNSSSGSGSSGYSNGYSVDPNSSGVDSGSTAGTSEPGQSQSMDPSYSSQPSQYDSSTAVLSDQMRNPIWQRNLGETDGRGEGYSVQTMPNLPK